EDFRIKGGTMTPGPTVFSRFVDWSAIAIKEKYYEGLKEACNNWERVSEEMGNKISLMISMRNNRSYKLNEIEWHKIPKAFIAKICANEEHAAVLLEIYICSEQIFLHVDEAYKLFSPYFTILVYESLIGFFNSVINDSKAYLSVLEDLNGRSHNLLVQRKSKLHQYKLCLVKLRYFTKKTLDELNKSNNCCFRHDITEAFTVIINDIKVINKRIQELNDRIENRIMSLHRPFN
ncbi:hypothetical protein PAEPH01_2576, partial [Pancytospora epiphaga]